MQSSQPQSSQFLGFRKTTVWPFHFLTPPTNHRLVAHNTVTQWYKPPAPRADKLDCHSHRGENQARPGWSHSKLPCLQPATHKFIRDIKQQSVRRLGREALTEGLPALVADPCKHTLLRQSRQRPLLRYYLHKQWRNTLFSSLPQYYIFINSLRKAQRRTRRSSCVGTRVSVSNKPRLWRKHSGRLSTHLS